MRVRLSLLLAALAVASVATAQPVSDYVFMQIVAHPDDDLLFMNPDLQNTLGAGYGSFTVMLTAAEAAGGADGESQAVFAGLRQEGLRAAYADMAGASNDWTRTVLWAVDHWVEYDILNGAPQVRLVFLNIPDGGDPDRPLSLLQLYNNPGFTVATFIPQGSTVTTPYVYSRASLIATLADLMEFAQPCNLRTLDPQPALICGSWNGDDCAEWLLDDNPDHINAARFADEAVALYQWPVIERGLLATFYYKGYAIAAHRGNLSPTNYTRKRSVCDVYKAYDSNFRLYEDGYAGMFGATYERYPGSTTWLQRQADGCLAAFAVQGRQVVCWQEMSVGGAWIGPTALGGAPVAPRIDCVRLDDGRLRLVALQIPLGGAGDSPPGPPLDQQILTCVQNGIDGAYTGWESIGSPDPFFTTLGHWVGMPAVAVNAEGRAEVFARNAAGGVSRCSETAGSGWSAWEALPSVSDDDVVDGLAATRAVDGRLEVFASYRSGDMAHWRQQANGSYLLDPAFPPINVAGPPTVTRNQDGRLEIFYLEAGSATVRTAFFTPGGIWSTNLVDLGGHGGAGPVAAMLREASGQIMLFARNNYSGVSTVWQAAPNASFNAAWVDLGGLIPAFPAAACDANGRVVLATVGVGGQLYIRRETTASIGSFGPWTPVGGAAVGVDTAPALGAILEPNFPNPFNPQTTLSYSLAAGGRVRLSIVDVSGRELATLVDAEQAAGRHTEVWDGRDAGGHPLAAGVYVARLETGGRTRAQKLVLAR
jgi:hypothetical protein